MRLAFWIFALMTLIACLSLDLNGATFMADGVRRLTCLLSN
jgi:hypothetical protein